MMQIHIQVEPEKGNWQELTKIKMNNSISSKNGVTVSYNTMKPSKLWNLKKGGGASLQNQKKSWPIYFYCPNMSEHQM